MSSHHGFTLLECLLSLVVLMSLLLFLQPFLKTLMTMEERAKKSDYLEVQTGKIQMEMEVRQATFQTIENNRLIYNHPEEGLIIFEQYQNMIRKTSHQNGHQPIMMGVDTVSFVEKNKLIHMEVITREKERYTYFFFP